MGRRSGVPIPLAHPSLYAPDEFRIADHTPVLVDLELASEVPVSASARAFGHLVLVNSAGLKAGRFRIAHGFRDHARTRRRGAQPQGSITVLIRRTEADGLHYYLVRAPTVATLTTTPGSGQATLTAPARIWDITRTSFPRVVEMNASIRISMDDNDEPGVLSDTLGVTVLNRQGALWFSSRWNGSKTVEQPIDSGNVRVR